MLRGLSIALTHLVLELFLVQSAKEARLEGHLEVAVDYANVGKSEAKFETLL